MQPQKAGKEKETIKLPSISNTNNAKPRVEYKEKESTILSTSVENYPTRPLYQPVTHDYLKKANSVNSKNRLKK